jgi:hypothetical protein
MAVNNPGVLRLLVVEDQVILIIGVQNAILAKSKRQMRRVSGAQKPGVRGSGYIYAAATKAERNSRGYMLIKMVAKRLRHSVL